MEITEEARELHKKSLVMDIHCHPTLKIQLFDYVFYLPGHHYFVFPLENPKKDEIFRMQYDLPHMLDGGVKAIWSSVYIVERGLVEHSIPLQFGTWITKGLGFNFESAIEDKRKGDHAFYQAISLIEIMEAQIARARMIGFKVSMPRNINALELALKDGETCLVNSLEGAHMLGSHLPNVNAYSDRIDSLKQSGVCSMTLGHFMPNDICYPVNGISPHTKSLLGFDFDYRTYSGLALTPIGKAVAEKMFDTGMIVDLNHVSPAGRKHVYEINDLRGNGNLKPLVFSHTGLR